MNCLQHSFEFEFLPTDPRFEVEFLPDECEFPLTDALNDYCDMLSGKGLADRDLIREMTPEFLTSYRAFLQDWLDTFNIRESLPGHIVLVTLAKFSNNYYTLREPGISILALGNWERGMAPPSILEFIVTLILREAVAATSPSLRGSIHLGTKGCLLDFTVFLDEVRYKVLQGFICTFCRESLMRDGRAQLVDELMHILDKSWLGDPAKPTSPAGIVSNLGHDLFLTKGLKQTPGEHLSAWLQKD
jgi:hypothetical protein